MSTQEILVCQKCRKSTDEPVLLDKPPKGWFTAKTEDFVSMPDGTLSYAYLVYCRPCAREKLESMRGMFSSSTCSVRKWPGML